jgi:hypothetical protein
LNNNRWFSIQPLAVICAIGFLLSPLTGQEPKKQVAKPPREIALPSTGGRGLNPIFNADNASLVWWDGKSIATWDLEQEKVVAEVKDAAWQFVLSSDGKRLATDMQKDGEPIIKVIDMTTQKELHQLSRPPGGNAKIPVFRSNGFDRTAAKLFTRTDLDLQVWDVKTGKMLRRIERPVANNMSFRSADGRYLTIDDAKASVQILDTQTEKFVPIRVSAQDIGRAIGKPNGGIVYSYGGWNLSHDGKVLYGTDDINGVLLEYSLPQGRLINSVKIPDLVFVKVSANGARMLGYYRDKKVLGVFDGKTRRELFKLGPFEKNVNWFDLSPDARWAFVSNESGGGARLFDFGAPTTKKK